MKEIVLIPSFEPNHKLIELVETIDLKRFDIIVVNDGSSNKYDKVFEKIKNKVHLISYHTNRGKGYALKTGLTYIKNYYQDNYLVVTIDSDGQHKTVDAIKLCDYVKTNPHTLVLGMRKRNNNTPLRSKIGNVITKFVYEMVTNYNIYDTQTGLRCFTDELTDFLLSIKGNRFEYEMNVLLYASKNDIKIHEIEINTIYYNKNKESHFKTFFNVLIADDSIRDT